jgi:hypothetical protein
LPQKGQQLLFGPFFRPSFPFFDDTNQIVDRLVAGKETFVNKVFGGYKIDFRACVIIKEKTEFFRSDLNALAEPVNGIGAHGCILHQLPLSFYQAATETPICPVP